MKNPFSLDMLILEGNPRQRGNIYGESLRDKIRAHIELTQAATLGKTGSQGDAALRDRLAGTRLLQDARSLAPHLVEEIEGMAEAADVPFENAFMLNSIEYLASGGGPLQCSAVGVWGQPGRPTLLAQNADNAAAWKDFLTLLRIRYPESGLEVYTMTFTGMLGVYGLNSRGIGVVVNAVGDLNRSAAGIGAPLTSRLILERTTLPQVHELMGDLRLFFGDNFMIGAPDGVVDYEVSGTRSCQVLPTGDRTRLFHTNHALAKDNRVDVEAIARARDVSIDDLNVNSRDRLQTLEHHLGDPTHPVTVADIKAVLSSHGKFSICAHEETGGGSRTNYGIIMELSDTPVLHLCTGAPCRSMFWEFKF